jgi:hypothetical protein
MNNGLDGSQMGEAPPHSYASVCYYGFIMYI